MELSDEREILPLRSAHVLCSLVVANFLGHLCVVLLCIVSCFYVVVTTWSQRLYRK